MTTITQPELDLFEPASIPVCGLCGHDIEPGLEFSHEARYVAGIADPICGPMQSALEIAGIWMRGLAYGQRCKGGVIVRNEEADLRNAAHFITKARRAWEHRIGELDAWLSVYARWLGIRDLLTGDALPNTERIVWGAAA
ncbi:hypothetical protein [Demequina globuliformis]|uniref:hypothetical protein n=1 Tax=Demequina globuliformis TaxID=676202 RepID=UPI000784447F|nr:hypothetical protein [Demequina globuliformis]